jgi:hypothetical protein
MAVFAQGIKSNNPGLMRPPNCWSEPFAPEGQRFEKGHRNPWLGRRPAWQAIAMLCKLSEKLFPVGAFLSRGANRSFWLYYLLFP